MASASCASCREPEEVVHRGVADPPQQKNAEFTPTADGVWRWSTSSPRLVIKFELLADSDSDPAEAVLRFDACENLGAVNLRGTGFAARDVSTATLRGKIGEDMRTAEVNITGLAGFLLAKAGSSTVSTEAEGLVRHRVRSAAQQCRWTTRSCVRGSEGIPRRSHRGSDVARRSRG